MFVFLCIDKHKKIIRIFELQTLCTFSWARRSWWDIRDRRTVFAWNMKTLVRSLEFIYTPTFSKLCFQEVRNLCTVRVSAAVDWSLCIYIFTLSGNLERLRQLVCSFLAVAVFNRFSVNHKTLPSYLNESFDTSVTLVLTVAKVRVLGWCSSPRQRGIRSWQRSAKSDCFCYNKHLFSTTRLTAVCLTVEKKEDGYSYKNQICN